MRAPPAVLFTLLVQYRLRLQFVLRDAEHNLGPLLYCPIAALHRARCLAGRTDASSYQQRAMMQLYY
jgi:hypothetical protein